MSNRNLVYQMVPSSRRSKTSLSLVGQVFCGMLLFSCSFAHSAGAQPLQGGVTVNESLQPPALNYKEPTIAKKDAPRPPCDCIPYDLQRVQAKQIDGRWKIVDGDHWIVDFDSVRVNAIKSVSALEYYKMNQICFVGRNSGHAMMFFLSDGKAPEGNIDGEESVYFNPSQVRAEQIDGNWKLTSGSATLEDFGSDERSAREAVEQIEYYGFTRKSTFGLPGPRLRYYLK
jgi:hypothetical protein